MIEQSVHSVLAIGVDVVRLAVSAKKAGYEVFAADYFGDQDLERVCLKGLSIVEQRPGATCGRMGTDFEAEPLLHFAKELADKNQIDGVLLSSGLDDSHSVLCELNDLIPMLGNQPDVIKRVRNKTDFFRELRRLGIHHPETVIVESFEEAKKEGKDIGYPVLVKPSRGFAGVGIRKAGDLNELKHAFKDASVIDEKVVVQEYISGIHASMSLISSTKETMILTLNAQLQGLVGVGQREPFGYCGNVVPLVTTRIVVEKCKTISERITSHFGLVGSNGVDLVVSNEGEPYVVEVNPRFQATLECVERVLRLNVVEAQVNA